ncbi:MAG TPA: mandelate racemase/muconate lactonizing enzyme family protein [archaeon]|nr:mandelate racemase/muconate lactonizing enzyme family protein [archaeon]
MRITDVRTTIVSIPFKKPEIWSMGRRVGVSNVIIEVETDTGLTGLGESIGFPSCDVIKPIIDSWKDTLIGEDPLRTESLRHRLEVQGGWQHFDHTGNVALAGVDIALWDLVGKAAGLPLYVLFGGLVRDTMSFMYFLPRGPIKEMTAQAAKGVKEGWETIYIKVGVDIEEEIEVVRAIRKSVGPRPKIRVDANEAWRRYEALRFIRAVEPYGIEFFEQPILKEDFDGLKWLRSMTSVPIAANQSSWTEQDILKLIRQEAADIMLLDPWQIGGLARFARAAWMAQVAGVAAVKHSWCELGIGTYAAMHTMAASANFPMANQAYPEYLSGDVCKGDLFHFCKGCLSIPHGPGIGVELDRRKLEKYARVYQQEGEFFAYAPHEGQKKRA